MKDSEGSINELEDIIGYHFRDSSLLKLALTHRSYAFEQGLPAASTNERLEFLGDAVVETAASHFLYDNFPQLPEGDMTKLRASLVRGKSLARIARKLGLNRYVFLSKGEEASGGRQKDSIMADTFEAVVGAVYLDGGFEVARGMVINCIGPMVARVIDRGTEDYKSELQEQAAKRSDVPVYLIEEEGPDHFKTFYATVEVRGKKFGPASGSTKKDAEQQAARIALEELGWDKR
ncbi:MAG: ribonuclease III [Actinomycetota bacterium]|nr:ribonuclease III [Actinomycetota bacterium]